jgi:hypothetical protein
MKVAVIKTPLAERDMNRPLDLALPRQFWISSQQSLGGSHKDRRSADTLPAHLCSAVAHT